MIMFLSMIPLYDYNYAGSNSLQLVLLLAGFHDLCAQDSSILDCFFLFVIFHASFAFFPFFFPLLNTCIHSGCWDNFMLMTIFLTISTSCIVAFYFGVEVLGQLNYYTDLFQ